MKASLIRPGFLELCVIAALFTCPASADAQQIPLQALVTPSTVIVKDGHPVAFAVHGFIEFKSLSELFPYIDSQTQRWKSGLNEAGRRQLARDLLRRGVESRVVSMVDERPFETLMTHTRDELQQALHEMKEPVPDGYADAFLAVHDKWKHALNCWSAAPSIPARVLSNWYPIAEGIQLYGSTYDSTEHFWQGVKYHPDTTVAELAGLLQEFEKKDWTPWLARLDADPKLYLPNAYAVEFVRHNVAPEKLRWFAAELGKHGLRPEEHARLAQQRGPSPFRFSAYEEKVLWGDLADMFYLVNMFSLPNDPIRKELAANHFDYLYLGDRKMEFVSQEFRELMLEVFKVKYLQMPRFREVITLIPMEIRIEHFLNDGDSPDIPIPTYVGYLNQVRELARQK
jgi:hypothetical protein